MTKSSKAYKLEFQPIRLKEMCIDCGISQPSLGQATSPKLSRSSMNLIFNRGYEPPTHPKYREQIEAELKKNPRAVKWLIDRNMHWPDIWQQSGKDMRYAVPAEKNQRSAATRRRAQLEMCDLDEHIIKLEVEMESLRFDTMRHFNLTRNPFKSPQDVQSAKDIFMSEDHRYIETAMLDTAKNGGFLAVIGECGAGKSIILRKVIDQLKKDGGCHIIAPRSNLDCTTDQHAKSKITPGRLIDAIIRDISDQKVDTRVEHKARQMEALLIARSQQGYQSVLIIDEAHSLQLNTFKYLKRFSELEDGYKRLLAIILVGQPEMNRMLDEELHPELREVIRRVQKAEIRGLNGDTKSYLALKFKRVGAKVDDIIDDKAIAAISRRLTMTDRREKTISHAYPLTIHSYVASAMNMACDMGEKKVTEEVVMAM